MFKIISVIAIGLLALKAPHVFGQKTDSTDSEMTISAQYRPRFEIRNGNFRPLLKSEKPAILITDRLRFSFEYQYKNIVTFKIAPQAVGLWGQASMIQGIENDGNKLALFEAWTKIKIAKKWDLQVGRQVISLDDERIFGELDWAQGGRSHDAASIHFQNNGITLKGYLGYNQNYKQLYQNNINNISGNLYSTKNAYPYKLMQTIWANFKLGHSQKLSVLVNNIGYQNALSNNIDTVTHYLHTMGIYYQSNHPKWLLSLSGYYQTGHNSGGLTTNAILAAIYLQRNVNSKVQVGVGLDYLSGNNYGTVSNKNRAFNPLFHTGHKFYGLMDYYFVADAHSNVGLLDYFIKGNYKISAKNNIQLVVHQFQIPSAIMVPGQYFNRNLGLEIDISYNHTINKITTLQGGYSLYKTTPTLLLLKSVNNADKIQQWFWLSIQISPNLLKSKFKS